MLFVAALVAVVSFFVGPTRWLGVIVLFCLAFSAWFLAWPETVASAEVWNSLAIFGLLAGGLALGVGARVVADGTRRPGTGR